MNDFLKRLSAEKVITEKIFKKLTGITFTSHTGKMAGVRSLSTSCLNNTFCQKRIKSGDSVCSKCYANHILNFRKRLKDSLNKNFEVLTKIEIPTEYWPTINEQIFRFESFGDLQNVIHFCNYCNFADKNKNTHFALWTKNPQVIQKYVDQGKKNPDNLHIICSSYKLNEIQNFDKFNFVEKVFTVYTKEHIESKKVEINCGARSCNECRKCYMANTIKYISEKLK